MWILTFLVETCPKLKASIFVIQETLIIHLEEKSSEAAYIRISLFYLSIRVSRDNMVNFYL